MLSNFMVESFASTVLLCQPDAKECAPRGSSHNSTPPLHANNAVVLILPLQPYSEITYTKGRRFSAIRFRFAQENSTYSVKHFHNRYLLTYTSYYITTNYKRNLLGLMKKSSRLTPSKSTQAKSSFRVPEPQSLLPPSFGKKHSSCCSNRHE